MTCAAWMRRLDDDALSGALWRRRGFVVATLLLCGTASGALLGGVGGLVYAAARPDTRLERGPGGGLVTVAVDDTAVPLFVGMAGAVVGLGLVAALLAARRRPRSR